MPWPNRSSSRERIASGRQSFIARILDVRHRSSRAVAPSSKPRTRPNLLPRLPCDLKRGEKVTFILSLHGGGSYGNWQRHYFPILDYTDKYRLVIATPFSPRRVWTAEDDGYLQNIVTNVIDEIGRENIKAFWLAGHSQGGLTSTRIVCSDFFKTKVDGFLSLSGGRVGGQAGRAANFGVPPARGATETGRGAAPPAGLPAGALVIPPPPTCDFSHIFETGEHEISALPPTSERAQKYGCSSEARRREVVDTKAGYVYDGTRQDPGSKAWGLLPRPGKAEILSYRNCRDKRVVADVVRIDKGHTEGLEPRDHRGTGEADALGSRRKDSARRLIMRTRLLSLLVVALSVAVLGGQSSLPADIHPESLSRLPPVQRGDLNDDGKRIWDAIAGGRGMPRTGPAAVSMYSPRAAESIQALNQELEEDRRRKPILRAVSSHRSARIRSAVRVVGTRAGGTPRRTRAVSHRRREVQP